MKKTENAKKLRREAEEKVASQPVFTVETDVKRLLHKLQVHQVELEMQNEELCCAQKKLESIVTDRTAELTGANLHLTQEIEERKKAEATLKDAFAEIKQLTEQLHDENIGLKQMVSHGNCFGEIVGQSPAVAYVFFRIDQVAPQDTTVLLLGETGSGKGMIARAIHRRSSRKDRPMITVNCTTLPANLIESELFGRGKGAFTGAHARQMGRFELANGGTSSRYSKKPAGESRVKTVRRFFWASTPVHCAPGCANSASTGNS